MEYPLLYNENSQKILIELVKYILKTNREQKENTVTYGEVATMIGYKTPRIGRLLGKIGDSLDILRQKENFSDIPCIMSLVVNAKTKLPGCGIDKFIPGYEKLSDSQKHIMVQPLQESVFNYNQKWLSVLTEFGLKINN